MAELALGHDQRELSWAISTAWACRSWCGAKRRLTPAAAAVWCNGLRAADASQRQPAVGP